MTMFTSAAAVVASATTISASTIPVPEDPELLALGHELDTVEAAFLEADRRQREAITAYERTRPAVPDDLVLKRGDVAPLNWCGDQERDVHGRLAWLPNIVRDGREYAVPPRYILTADKLRTMGLEDQPDRRTALNRDIRRRLAIAERYEAADADARERAGVDAALQAHHIARRDVINIVFAIDEVAAQTWPGLAIKARVIALFAAMEHGAEADRESLPHGVAFAVGMANDVDRINNPSGPAHSSL
jgi:hypothetical protein